MNLIFARQSAAQEPEFSGERLIGVYPQTHPDRGVGQFILAPSPGFQAAYTLASGKPVRAILADKGNLFAVCDGSLWRGDARLGTVPDGPTTLASNGFDVALVANGEYYVYNKATETLSLVLPSAFDAAKNITTLDGYMVLTEQAGQRFSISGLNDAKSLDALDFAAAESGADDLVRVYADHSELWLFGESTTEIWANTGNADFPFQRVSGGRIERGCAFAGSVASEDNTVFWIGDNRLVYRAQGYTPQVISTPYIASIIEDMPNDADITAFTFGVGNSTFYVLRLPDAPALIYDAASNMWHERSTGVDYGPWAVTCAARIGATIYLGTSDGRICTLGGVSDGGAVLLREATSLPLSAQRARVSLNELELHFRTGQTDIGRAASVMIEHSTNGRIWKPERRRSLGQQGQYDRLVRCRNFGQGRQHQVRWRITDPIDVSLYGVTVKAS